MDIEFIYQEYAEFVYQFLYFQTCDAEWSQELMQETFLRAVTSISRYNGSWKLSVWLCQIAKHVYWQELRKKKQINTVKLEDALTDFDMLDGESNILHQENRLEIYQTIHNLSKLEREVVLCRITGELLFVRLEQF